MLNSSVSESESEFLKALLPPLLEDFQYWFERSRRLLQEEAIAFLGPERQGELLEQVKQAEQELQTVQTLVQVMGLQAGVETTILMKWHQLVTQCWQVAMEFRIQQNAATGLGLTKPGPTEPGLTEPGLTEPGLSE